MPQEIERRFVIENEDWVRLVYGQDVIRQGYLNIEPRHTVRVRVVGDKNAFITVKGPSAQGVRDEFEYPIPLSDAMYMLGMCQYSVEKIRYRINDGGKVWDEITDNHSYSNSELAVTPYAYTNPIE